MSVEVKEMAILGMDINERSKTMSAEVKEMVEEAKTRMVILGMLPNIISDFEKDILHISIEEEGSVRLDNQSDGDLFAKARKIVDWFEEEFGGVVYHVSTNGIFMNLMYVSKWDEEWLDDRESLKDEGYDVEYVLNLKDEVLSELGGVIVEVVDGLVKRIA